MKHAIAHDLDPALAKRVVEKAFASYKERFPDYQPTLRWAHDTRADVTFCVKGLTLEGGMTLEPQHIDLELEVPFLFRPFQKRAIAIIEDEVRAWLEKARTGALG